MLYFSFIHGILRKRSNNRKRLTENKLVVTRRERVWGEGD